MLSTLLILAFLAFLWKYQTDLAFRPWYIFAAGIVVLTQLGVKFGTLGLIVAIGVFKVFKDICQARNQ